MANPSRADSVFDPGNEVGQPESYLGYSKGFDTVGEAIGKGIGQIGDLFKDVVQGTDKIFKTKVQEGVEAAVDPIQAQAIQSYTLGKELPDPLNRSILRLNNMGVAAKQGAIADSHYWAMLDVEARKLRAQYPGYRDEIDAQFHRMTGAVPANKLIQDLRSEANAGAGKEHTDLMNELHWARENGVPEVMGLLQRGVSPEQMGLGQIRAWNAAMAVKIAGVKQEEAKLVLDKNRGEAADRQWSKTGQMALDADLNGRLSAMDTALAGKVRDLQDPSKTPEGMTPENKQALLAWVGQQRADFQQARNEFWYNKKLQRPDGTYTTYSQNVKDADRKAIFDIHDAHLKSIEDSITNDNFGWLAADRNFAKMSEEGAYSKAMQNEFNARTVAARKVYGEQGFAAVINRGNANNLKNLDAAFDKFFTLNAIDPNSGGFQATVDRAKQAAKEQGIPEGRANKLALDAHIETILNAEAPLNARAQAAKNLFSDPGIYARANADAKDRLWTALTNPQMTQAMQELAKNGRTDAQNAYNYTLQTMFGTRISQVGNGIKALVEQPGQFGLEYDTKTMTFAVKETNFKPKEGSAFIDTRPELHALAAQANSSVRNFAEARKAQGATPEQINQDVAQFFAVKGNLDISKMLYKPPGGKEQDNEEARLIGEAARKGALRSPPAPNPSLQGVPPPSEAPLTESELILQDLSKKRNAPKPPLKTDSIERPAQIPQEIWDRYMKAPIQE